MSEQSRGGVALVTGANRRIGKEAARQLAGAYRMTIALLGLLRQSEHPRIVNVSSGMAGVAQMGGWSPG